MQKSEFNQNGDKSVVTWGGSIGGIFFILFGLLFLLGQSGIDLFDRSPWILFGLLPIFGIFVAAWNRYQASGRKLTREVVMILLGGLFPFAFVAAVILGLNPALIVPGIFILIGLSMIVPTLRK